MPISSGEDETFQSDRAPFHGAWELLSCEVARSDGAVERPFGEQPAGLIIYERSGRMSAQIMSGRVLDFPNSDPSRASADEASQAWRDYLGYWGTFQVDEARGLVIHHIEGGWFPNWNGRDQTRRFSFGSPDLLVLEADSPVGLARLRWRRIGPGVSYGSAEF